MANPGDFGISDRLPIPSPFSPGFGPQMLDLPREECCKAQSAKQEKLIMASEMSGLSSAWGQQHLQGNVRILKAPWQESLVGLYGKNKEKVAEFRGGVGGLLL